jgi:hypothetical protein
MPGEKRQKILLSHCNQLPAHPYLMLDACSLRNDEGLAGLIRIQDYRALCAFVIQ